MGWGGKKTVSNSYNHIQDLWNKLRLEAKLFDAIKRQIILAAQAEWKKTAYMNHLTVSTGNLRGYKVCFPVHDCVCVREICSCFLGGHLCTVTDLC